MSNFFRGIIRASSFIRKEIFEIIRQPRLLITLVLGPFLILLAFGLGYHSEPRTLRTLFVAQSTSPISAQEIEEFGKSVGSLFVFAGVTPNQNEALDQLKQGLVDVVIVEPGNATDVVKKNQQAVFVLYQNEIDPDQANYINYLGWLYVDQVNQHVLRLFAVEGQKDAVTIRTNLQEAHQNVADMRQAVQSGDETTAQQKQQGLASNVDAVSQVFGASLGVLDSMNQTQGANEGNASSAQGSLTDLRQNTNDLSASTNTKQERLARLDKIDKDITDLDAKLAQFQSLNPTVMVSPFRNETISVAKYRPSVMEFFFPAVMALLLQHLAVTIAALSIVRERNAGTMEFFRVSPLSAAEALFGKYMSYLLFGGVIAAILSALAVLILHIPMLGNWWNFALVIAAILFSSLGIGFAISIISQTDSQAVQYSMIILLASVFFSGFLSPNMLSGPVKVISWLLPTTYGTFLLRDIALRGFDPNWVQMVGLFAMGLFLMLVSWRLMRRMITSSQ